MPPEFGVSSVAVCVLGGNSDVLFQILLDLGFPFSLVVGVGVCNVLFVYFKIFVLKRHIMLTLLYCAV